jgi:hypothetical protein
MDQPRCWVVLLLLVPVTGLAQVAYQKPPREVLDVLNAPVTPGVSLSPTRDRLLLVERERYPPISELALPMLGLAGVRFNPQNRGPYRAPQNVGITIQTIPAGEKIPVNLAPGTRLSLPLWAPDGSQFAFAAFQPTRVELWVADAKTGAARKMDGIVLNAIDGPAFQWMPDARTLLCRTVPGSQGPPPSASGTPSGPNIQESFGKTAPVRTYQDLLKNAHDETLFEYYATSQLILVDAATGRKQALGQPDVFSAVDPAPGGEFFLLTTTRKPFSRLLGSWGFPSEVVVWDEQGKTVHTVANLPSHEGVPIEGVLTGPRSVRWRPTAPATLVWVEALRPPPRVGTPGFLGCSQPTTINETKKPRGQRPWFPTFSSRLVRLLSILPAVEEESCFRQFALQCLHVTDGCVALLLGASQQFL